MPIFYFDVRHGDEWTPDMVVKALPRSPYRHQEAEAALPELARRFLWNGARHDIGITVRNELGAVATVTLSMVTKLLD